MSSTYNFNCIKKRNDVLTDLESWEDSDWLDMDYREEQDRLKFSSDLDFCIRDEILNNDNYDFMPNMYIEVGNIVFPTGLTEQEILKSGKGEHLITTSSDLGLVNMSYDEIKDANTINDKIKYLEYNGKEYNINEAPFVEESPPLYEFNFDNGAEIIPLMNAYDMLKILVNNNKTIKTAEKNITGLIKFAGFVKYIDRYSYSKYQNYINRYSDSTHRKHPIYRIKYLCIRVPPKGGKKKLKQTFKHKRNKKSKKNKSKKNKSRKNKSKKGDRQSN